MENLYQKAHPGFIMPNIDIPDGFIDSSYQDDEYPSWSTNDIGNNDHPSIQIWIAYDHGYSDRSIWDEVLKNGIYQICFDGNRWISTNDFSKIVELIQEYK